MESRSCCSKFFITSTRSSRLWIALALIFIILHITVSAWTTTTARIPRAPFNNKPLTLLPHIRTTRRFALSSSSSSSSKEDTIESSSSNNNYNKIQELKESAEKIRLQAKQMEIDLLKEKLDKVTIKLGKNGLKDDERQLLLKEQESIKQRLDPASTTTTAAAPGSTVSVKVEPTEGVPMDALNDFVNNDNIEKERDTTASSSSSRSSAKQGGFFDNFIESIKEGLEESDNNGTIDDLMDNKNLDKIEDFNFTLNEGTDDEITFAVVDELTPEMIEEMGGLGGKYDVNYTAKSQWDSNETEFLGQLQPKDYDKVKLLYDDWNSFMATLIDLADKKMNDTKMEDRAFVNQMNDWNKTFEATLIGNVSQTELDTILGVAGLVNFVKKFAPGSVFDMVEEAKIYSDFEDEDPLYLERLEQFTENFRKSLFSRIQNQVSLDDANSFCEDILNKNTNVFVRTSPPKMIGSAYLIEGRSLVDGDDLITTLLKDLQQSDLANRIELFHVRDPSNLVDLDEIETADLIQNNAESDGVFEFLDVVNKIEPPALMLTGKNLNYRKGELQSALTIWGVSIITLTMYSGFCYAPVNDPITAVFAGLQSPIVYYVLGNFALQHLIQGLFALKGGFSIPFIPKLIPGFGTFPLVASKVEILSPPKNNNDLFDFAFAGPLTSLFVSIGMFLLGLQTTMQLSNAADIARLPQIDFDLVSNSYLAGATIETVVGTNIFLSLGDTTSSMIPCDPLTIAGFIGMIFHSLQFLPGASESNGGRLVQSLFGRFAAETGILQIVSTIFLVSIALRADASTFILAAALLATNVVYEGEIPCRNDVDKASKLRLPFYVASILLAALALSPPIG